MENSEIPPAKEEDLVLHYQTATKTTVREHPLLRWLSIIGSVTFLMGMGVFWVAINFGQLIAAYFSTVAMNVISVASVVGILIGLFCFGLRVCIRVFMRYGFHSP